VALFFNEVLYSALSLNVTYCFSVSLKILQKRNFNDYVILHFMDES
jgi:hypothetical protein